MLGENGSWLQKTATKRSFFFLKKNMFFECFSAGMCVSSVLRWGGVCFYFLEAMRYLEQPPTETEIRQRTSGCSKKLERSTAEAQISRLNV